MSARSNPLLRRALGVMPAEARSLAIALYGHGQARSRFGESFHYFSELLDRTQHLEPEALAAFQRFRLTALLDSAIREVPYYRDRKVYTSAVEMLHSGEDLKTVLTSMPRLSRQDAIEAGPSLTSDRLDRRAVVTRTSSGTTGTPFSYLLSRDVDGGLSFALLYRFYSWAGIRRGARRATLGAARFADKPPYHTYNPAEQQLVLSAHHLNEVTVRDYVAELRAYKPQFLTGHPSAIAFLAERAEGVPSVQAVFTTGETLGDHEREHISAAFRCEVFESYGQGESVTAAFECENHHGFHAASEFGLCELVGHDDQKEVVATTLWNWPMPLIRYEPGDLALPAEDVPCPCGRTLPLIFHRVVGRVDEALQTPDGRTVFPLTIRQFFSRQGDIAGYQLRQVDEDRCVLSLVAEPLDGGREAALRRDLLGLLGTMRLDVEYLAEIPVTAGGKVRVVVNETEHRRPVSATAAPPASSTAGSRARRDRRGDR